MRVESAREMANGGWLHVSPGAKPIPTKHQEASHDDRPTIDAAAMIGRWQRGTTPARLAMLAVHLGLPLDGTLESLGACWAPEHKAFAFPMFDGQGAIVGVRLRSDNGRKWAVRGSRAGIFIPSTLPQDMALIPEGPTDTAAAVSLGFFAIGRPSCSAGALEISGACRRLGIKEIVMVVDRDVAGYAGARTVAKKIELPTRFWMPPTKDLRDFLRRGGTRQLAETMIQQNGIYPYGY